MSDKSKTAYELIPKLGQLRDDVLFGDVSLSDDDDGQKELVFE